MPAAIVWPNLSSFPSHSAPANLSGDYAVLEGQLIVSGPDSVIVARQLMVDAEGASRTRSKRSQRASSAAQNMSDISASQRTWPSSN